MPVLGPSFLSRILLLAQYPCRVGSEQNLVDVHVFRLAHGRYHHIGEGVGGCSFKRRLRHQAGVVDDHVDVPNGDLVTLAYVLCDVGFVMLSGSSVATAPGEITVWPPF